MRNVSKYCNVQDHDIPAGRTPVWDVVVGGGEILHGQRSNVPRVSETIYPLPVLWSITYRRIDDGAQM